MERVRARPVSSQKCSNINFEVINVLTLFRTESEYPYHVRGGAPEATPCISGTIHQKVTKLLEHTYVGKYRGFKA